MEVDPGRGLVGVLGDAEVHSDFKAGYLGSIHRLSRLLRVLDSLEVDESESPGSLGRAVQHHRHLLQLAESAELSLEVPLCGCEVETKHSNAVRRFGIFTIAINLRKVIFLSCNHYRIISTFVGLGMDLDLDRVLDLDLDLMEPDLDLLRYLPGLDGLERDRDLLLDLDLDLETGLEPDLEPGLALLGGEGDLL